jgi:SAM-dependent methyltransferase
MSGPTIDGCDYNRELVKWCESNLAFLRASKTELQPPLPYADGTFDFLYAFSVFTHLSAQLAEQWMAELRRVVKPGGLIWFTIHGESYSDQLLDEEKVRFRAGQIIVRLPEIEGTNLCSSFWPHASITRMLGSEFEMLVHLDPSTDPDTAQQSLLEHDAYLVRRV